MVRRNSGEAPRRRWSAGAGDFVVDEAPARSSLRQFSSHVRRTTVVAAKARLSRKMGDALAAGEDHEKEMSDNLWRHHRLLLPTSRRRRTRAPSALLLYRSPRTCHAGSHGRGSIRGPGPRGGLWLSSERRARWCRSGFWRWPQARRCQQLRQLCRDLIRSLLHHRHRIHRRLYVVETKQRGGGIPSCGLQPSPALCSLSAFSLLPTPRSSSGFGIGRRCS